MMLTAIKFATHNGAWDGTWEDGGDEYANAAEGFEVPEMSVRLENLDILTQPSRYDPTIDDMSSVGTYGTSGGFRK